MPPACTSTLEQDERLFLMTIVDAFHGSTALQQTLMGSDSLSTLCSTRVFQCEGRKLLPDQGADMFDILTLYGNYWNLSKPVFFDKSPGLTKSIPRLYDTQLENHVRPDGELPPVFQKLHIRILRLAFVVMWRPLCIAQLSSHTPETPDFKWASAEARQLEVLLKDVRWLQEQAMRFMVLSFGQLVWNPDTTQRRLQSFLPCLSGLNTDFVPQMNVDIFPENRWKAKGSVRQFGQSMNPKLLGYDVAANKCHGEWSFKRLLSNDPELLDRTLRNELSLEILSA